MKPYPRLRYQSMLGALLTLGLACSVPGQSGPSEPAAASEPEAGANESAEAVPVETETAPPVPVPDSNIVPKRLFGIIPNYRADQNPDSYTPLTTSQKFHIARSDTFDWPNYFLLAGLAMQEQVAAGGFSHNGGAQGFAKFYARGLGDQIVGNYVTEAILPTLLHEDPRFFRLGSGTFWHRATYATSRIFVTRTDSGGTQFNISEIAGNAGVVAVTSLYYPDGRTGPEAAERYAMQLGNDAVSNLLTEFWPDIKHHLRFRRKYFFIP